MKNDWTSCIAVLNQIHRAEERVKLTTKKLREEFLAKWEKVKDKSKANAKAFADDFEKTIDAAGYNGKWARRQCTEGVDAFRQRAAGAGRKASAPSWEKLAADASKLSKADLRKLIAALAKM
jgi:hypothetical protein